LRLDEPTDPIDPTPHRRRSSHVEYIFEKVPLAQVVEEEGWFTIITLLARGVFLVFVAIFMASIVLIGFSGLVIFFYISILVICSVFVNMMTNITIGDGLSVNRVIVWCLWIGPLIELMLAVNYKILFSFFDDLWELVAYGKLSAYLQRVVTQKKWYWMLRILLVLVILSVPIQLLIYIIGVGDWADMLVYIIGILSAVPIVVSLVRQVLYPWGCFWFFCLMEK
jgi:hypothetical protein